MALQQSKKFIMDSYEKQAPEYERTRFASKSGKLMDLLEKYQLVNYLKGTRILEIGVGCGRFLHILQSLGFEIYGIDISNAMLSIAKKKAENLRNVELIRMDGSELGFRSNSFDSIFMVRTFKFIPRPICFLKGAYEILRNRGRIIILYENRDVFWRKRKIISEWKERYYTFNEMEDMFKLVGFKILVHKKTHISAYSFSKVIPDTLLYLLIRLESELEQSPLRTNSLIVGEK